MKTILPLNIKAYEFKDLNKDAQNKAITDYIKFMMDSIPYEYGSDNYRKAIDEAKDMKTPWFSPMYIYKYCKDEIIDAIEMNEYLFDEKGNLLPIMRIIRNGKVHKTLLEITEALQCEICIHEEVSI